MNSKIQILPFAKKSVDHLRESIIKLLTNYKYSKDKDLDFLKWALDIRITGFVFKRSKYGWLFFFSQINDKSLLGALDHFIQTQLKRYDIKGIKPKSFLRAYHEITQNLSKTTYIPNFDKTPIDEKRRILVDVFKFRNPPTEQHDIEYHFNKQIYKMAKEIEKDVARAS